MEPKQLKVGWRTFTLNFKWRPAKDSLGSIHQEKSVIRVARSLQGIRRAEVTLHELLHSVFHVWSINQHMGGDDSKEEAVVEALGHALVTTMKDNPEFWQWLLTEVQKGESEAVQKEGPSVGPVPKGGDGN